MTDWEAPEPWEPPNESALMEAASEVVSECAKVKVRLSALMREHRDHRPTRRPSRLPFCRLA